MIKHVWAAGLVGVVMAFAAAGCGEKSGGGAASGSATAAGGKIASCDKPKEMACVQYEAKNVAAAGIDFLKKTACSPDMGDFKEVGCSTDKLVATCAHKEGTNYWYEGAPGLSGAEDSCKFKEGKYEKKK